MPRHLASVRTIDKIDPIEGADRIERATIGAWPVVVPKGAFAPGDKCVYFEIDSALDVSRPQFAFLAQRSVKHWTELDESGEHIIKREGHVLRTARMRGQISQGLAMTLAESGVPEDTPVGTDVTDILGVTKYDPYVPASTGTSRRIGGYPSAYCIRSDAERAQNLADVWDMLSAYTWYPTEKVDGTSSTILADTDDGHLRVASRNLEVAWYDEEPRVKAAIEYGLDKVLTPGMAIQFELVGPSINSNRLGLAKQRPIVFGVWQACHPLPRDKWPEACLDNAAPILDLAFPDSAEDALAQVFGMKSHISPERMAEGVVWHTTDGSQVPELDYRDCFKAVNDKYLLKYESK